MGKVHMLAAEQGRVEEEKPKVDDAEETAPIDPAEFTAKRKALEASVKKQGDLVCKLKADGKDAKTDAELQAAISELRQQKEELKTLVRSVLLFISRRYCLKFSTSQQFSLLNLHSFRLNHIQNNLHLKKPILIVKLLKIF